MAGLMPAVFFGHGTPMNALDRQPLHRGVAGVRGRACPRPRAILVRLGPLVHQRHRRHGDGPTRGRSTTSTASPTSCSPCEYPAPGRPGARRGGRRARRADLGRPRRRQLGHRPRHLVRARARLPRRRHPRRAAVDQRHQAVRRTTSSSAPSSRRCASGACSIVGSGNVVHNLGRIDWSQPDAGFDWAARFDDDAARRDDERARRMPPRSSEHRDFAVGRADAGPLHPAALPRRARRGRAARPPHVLVDGYAMGSLSMVVLHARLPRADPGGSGSPPLPASPRTRPTSDPATHAVTTGNAGGGRGGIGWSERKSGTARLRGVLVSGSLGPRTRMPKRRDAAAVRDAAAPDRRAAHAEWKAAAPATAIVTGAGSGIGRDVVPPRRGPSRPSTEPPVVRPGGTGNPRQLGRHRWKCRGRPDFLASRRRPATRPPTGRGAAASGRRAAGRGPCA